MIRFVAGACAVACVTLAAVGPATFAAPGSAPDLRTLPMNFAWRTEGPDEACAPSCRTWVSAVGAITADTPRDFAAFARQRDLRGATLALDSDGGSVLGALALGRAVRKLGMATTVGRTAELPAGRARLSPEAYCESMCAFVLLAGTERTVPPQARVLVHQIWLGDRRDDPTAAHYSAEDLVLVQRDIGKLAQYTIEMGGSINLIETALKIPPWEPMRLLSRDELRGMKIITAGEDAQGEPVAATTSVALSSGTRSAVNERSWMLGQRDGRTVLSRRHPLTVEGEDIGSFELAFACGGPGRDYEVTYVEHRHGVAARLPASPSSVHLSIAGRHMPLKVLASRRGERPGAIESMATGLVSAEQVRLFADPRSRSLTVTTASGDLSTAIRIGNAGVARSFARLSAACAAPGVARSNPRAAELRREAVARPR